MYVCMYVYIDTYMHTCIHTYTHTYMYIYMCIYTYIYVLYKYICIFNHRMGWWSPMTIPFFRWVDEPLVCPQWLQSPCISLGRCRFAQFLSLSLMATCWPATSGLVPLGTSDVLAPGWREVRAENGGVWKWGHAPKWLCSYGKWWWTRGYLF